MLEYLIALVVALSILLILVGAGLYYLLDEVDHIDPTKHEFDYYEDDKDEER